MVWSLVAIIAAAALVGLGWLLGTTEPEFRGSFVRPLEHTLRSTIVSAVVAAGLTLLLLWAVRRVYLCVLTYLPGPICVPEFTAGDKELEPLVAPLTLRFRQTLSGLYLDAQASSQPATTDASEFASLVGGISLDPKQAVSSAVALVRAAAPTHAYEVTGVLRRRPEEPRYGVALQVLIRPKNARALQLCWQATWERAVEHAANTAAGFILPQTRRSNLAPWRAWRRYVMPPRLLDAYERASARVEARRYEEALGLFREALEEDPMNLDIRLRTGMVQEQLGLFLDALDTYVAVETIETPPGRQPMRRNLPYRVREARRQTADVALYRRAVLLGGGQVAEQWMRWREGTTDTARDLQRRALRKRLEPWLKDRWPPDGGDAGDLGVTCQLSNDEFARRVAWLQYGLASIARQDLDRLIGSALHRPSKPLSPAAVATSRECVKLRQELARGARAGVKELEDHLRQAQKHRGRRSWEAQYNGACLYAIALEGAADENLRAELVDRAIKELKNAIACTDSGYVANRAPWLLREDPDLKALRQTNEFHRLEATYFGRDYKQDEEAPEDRHLAALREHTMKLSAGYAARLEELWHQRADKADEVDVHEAGRWWGREREAWHLMTELAVEFMDWETRLRAIEKLRSWAQEAGIPPLEIPYPPPRDWSPDPSYSEERIGLPADVLDKKAQLTVHLRSVDEQLRQVDRRGETLAPERFARLAGCQAALWQTVREDIEPPRFSDDPPREGTLEQHLDEVLANFRGVSGERAGPIAEADGGNDQERDVIDDVVSLLDAVVADLSGRRR